MTNSKHIYVHVSKNNKANYAINYYTDLVDKVYFFTFLRNFDKTLPQTICLSIQSANAGKGHNSDKINLIFFFKH